MAWNPEPEIDDLRKYAKKHGLQIVIAMVITDDGRIGYYSYGKTMKLCDSARDIADDLFEEMEEAASKHLEWEYLQ